MAILDSQDFVEGDSMGNAGASQMRTSDYWIVDALNAEWDRIASGHLESVGSWAAAHQALAGCTSPEAVLQAVGRDADSVLFALLAENAGGDELAGRVVLQAMMGKLVRMAARDRRAGADEYVAGMWCCIRTYPLRRRPARIAANLALDTLKAVTQESRWMRRGGDVLPVESAALLDELHTRALARSQLDHNAGVADLTARSVVATADRLGLIDAHTREVLLSVYADGLSGRAAAERHHTSAAMIRFRCSKAVRRLAEHSASLAEAA